MTQRTGNFAPAQEQRSTAEVAKEQAAGVGQTAVDQTKEVAGEAKRRARDLKDQGLEQLRDQARTGQQKAASGLNTVADQLERMSEGSDQSGMATDLVREAAQRVRRVASWLEQREPGDFVEEIRNFARRRPGVFLAGAAAAGTLVGRLTRGASSTVQEDDADDVGATIPQQQSYPSHMSPPGDRGYDTTNMPGSGYGTPPPPTTPPPPPTPRYPGGGGRT